MSEDERVFREAVLRQKELLAAENRAGQVGGVVSMVAEADLASAGLERGEAVGLLREIRDSLVRLEGRGGSHQ